MSIEQDFANNLFQFMEETFEAKHHGIYLDKGTSLFETLETVSSEEASIPVGGKCASLAAQVAHVTFYIESFERFALQGDNSPRDWGYIWRTVEKVTPGEWESYKSKLKDAYQRMDKLFHETSYGMKIPLAARYPLLFIPPITWARSGRLCVLLSKKSRHETSHSKSGLPALVCP